jgi:transcriptional regulator with GAF, ATPase, and Fis domain
MWMAERIEGARESRPQFTTQTSSHATRSDRTLRIRQAMVVFAPEASGARAVLLDAASIAVGREPPGTHALRVADKEASRHHCTIDYDAARDTYAIVDGDSRNGTYVDGERTARADVGHGSVVRVGKSLIVFVDVDIASDAPLARETATLRGQSLAMQRVRGEIPLVAPRPLPVLILGETGTGKERVAEEIHRQSGRSGAFVAVNCAAIAASLAESELFGHAQGAFTGASHRSDGLFVAADGGTLFLDEIGELPLAIQPKLLRALAEGEVRAVGRSDTRTVSVRVIAATHRDLEASVTSGSFRADLFARLAAWTIRLPPLRERREDVLRLATGFLERDATGEPQIALSSTAAEALVLYSWPFNVRQLEQVLAAAKLRAGTTGVLRIEHLPDEIARPLLARVDARADASPKKRSEPPLEILVSRDRPPTAEELRLVVARYEGNMAMVAEYFGKDRKQVYRWAQRLGVDPSAARVDKG